MISLKLVMKWKVKETKIWNFEKEKLKVSDPHFRLLKKSSLHCIIFYVIFKINKKLKNV